MKVKERSKLKKFIFGVGLDGFVNWGYIGTAVHTTTLGELEDREKDLRKTPSKLRRLKAPDQAQLSLPVPKFTASKAAHP